ARRGPCTQGRFPQTARACGARMCPPRPDESLLTTPQPPSRTAYVPSARETACTQTRQQPVGARGELIRRLNDSPSLRKVPIGDLVFDVVEGGGPLPYGCDSEEEGRSFESTCRKFRRFLEQQAR